MKQYSPMVFDFTKSTVKFTYEGMKVFLNGAECTNKVVSTIEGGVKRVIKKNNLLMMELFLCDGHIIENRRPVSSS